MWNTWSQHFIVGSCLYTSSLLIYFHFISNTWSQLFIVGHVCAQVEYWLPTTCAARAIWPLQLIINLWMHRSGPRAVFMKLPNTYRLTGQCIVCMAAVMKDNYNFNFTFTWGQSIQFESRHETSHLNITTGDSPV